MYWDTFRLSFRNPVVEILVSKFLCWYYLMPLSVHTIFLTQESMKKHLKDGFWFLCPWTPLGGLQRPLNSQLLVYQLRWYTARYARSSPQIFFIFFRIQKSHPWQLKVLLLRESSWSNGLAPLSSRFYPTLFSCYCFHLFQDFTFRWFPIPIQGFYRLIKRTNDSKDDVSTRETKKNSVWIFVLLWRRKT